MAKKSHPCWNAEKNEGLRVIPLILKPCTWQIVDWLSQIQGRPKDNKPLSGFNEHDQNDCISKLALEINDWLSNIPASKQSDAPENTVTSLKALKVNYDPSNPAFLVPFRSMGKYMVGRDAALEKVHQQLLAGKPTSIGQTALFQGIGGLGKTQLAVEYAYHYRDEYPNGVYWITADENIDAQLTQIAVSAHWVAPASEHVVKLDVARNRLKTNSSCLIIFDNLESVVAIRDYLPSASANPHILVTSRYEQVEFVDVELDLLNDEQSYLLLIQEAGKETKNEAEESAAREIVTALSGLPLALELAGAYLRYRHIGWCTYRDLLLDDLKKALPKQLASPTRHEADLFNTLRISEQGIDEEPLLVKVLDLLTWSDSSSMGLQLMAHLLEVEQDELYGALGLGHALRLLQKIPNSERYVIHRLVQEVRRQDRPIAQHMGWVNTTTQRLGDWFEEIRDDFHELPIFELEFEHLRVWRIHAELCSSIASVRLLWLQGYPADYRGRYDEASRIVQQALEVYATYDLDSKRLKAHLLNDLSSCHAQLGEYSRALGLCKEALEMRRELLGDKHHDVATSLNNLAGCHKQLGEYSRSLELCKEALKMQRELLGDKHPDVARSLNNLANFYSDVDDHARALELGNQALEMRRELLGESHPDTINSLLFILRRLYANPLTAGQGKALAEEFLKHIPHEHPSRMKVWKFLGNLKGFRKPGKNSGSKKRRKK